MKPESPIKSYEDPDRDWRELYRHLRERCDMHVGSCVRRVARYKRLAGTLHIVIPLASLLLTVLVTSNFPNHVEIAAGFAIALTILTGVNYILEPARRYREYVESSIALHDWRFELETQVQMLGSSSSARLLDYLKRKNESLSKIARTMSGLPIAREQMG
jgi:hypothetical protein